LSDREAIFYFADWGAVPQFGGGVTPVPGSILEVADIVPFVNKITVINYAFIAPDQNGNCYFITPDSLTHVGKAPYTQVGIPEPIGGLARRLPAPEVDVLGGWLDRLRLVLGGGGRPNQARQFHQQLYGHHEPIWL
jgi:hypothetical protein